MKKSAEVLKIPKGFPMFKLKLRLNIRAKILGAFMLSIVFLIFISIMAIVRMDNINNSSKVMSNVYTPGIKLLGELNTNLTEYRRQELKCATIKNVDEFTAVESSLVNVKAKIEQLSEEYEKNYIKSDDMKNSFNTFKKFLNNYIQNSSTIIDVVKSGDFTTAYYKLMGAEDVYNIINNQLNNIININYKSVMEESNNSNRTFNSSRLIFIITSALCMILLVGLAMLISMNISKPIVKLDKAVMAIASGDLSIGEIKIRNKDEIGSLSESFNIMVSSLRDIVKNVHMGAEQVSSSAEELTASAEQTSKSSEEISVAVLEVTHGVEMQSNDVEDILKTFDEMSKGQSEMALTIENSSVTAMKAAQRAKDGKMTIDDAVEHMKNIEEEVNVILTVMVELKRKSDNIEGIVSTISAIANQTNLLALNAAIEAARVGESGRGFAVVADEVKKLAAQSAGATKEIKGIITNIKKDIDGAEGATRNGAKAVDEGIVVINRAGDMFKDIVSGIEEVAVESQEIAATSEEIASGSEQVKESMSRTTGIFKKTSANMEGVAASVEEQSASMQQLSPLIQSLYNMSMELNSIVDKFKM